MKPLDSVGEPEEYIQGAMNAKTETEKAYYQAMLNAAIAKPMIETPHPYQQELQQMGYIPQNQPAQNPPATPVVKPQV